MTEDQLVSLAGNFEAQIKAAGIDDTAEIAVVFHWVDGSGRNVATTRHPAETRVQLSGMGSGNVAKETAHALYLGTVVDNMRNRVLSAPCELTRVSGSEVPVRVDRIELEIRAA